MCDIFMLKHGHGQCVIFLCYENCYSVHMLSIFTKKTLELFIVYTTKLIDVYMDSFKKVDLNLYCIRCVEIWLGWPKMG